MPPQYAAIEAVALHLNRFFLTLGATAKRQPTVSQMQSVTCRIVTGRSTTRFFLIYSSRAKALFI